MILRRDETSESGSRWIQRLCNVCTRGKVGECILTKILGIRASKAVAYNETILQHYKHEIIYLIQSIELYHIQD